MSDHAVEKVKRYWADLDNYRHITLLNRELDLGQHPDGAFAVSRRDSVGNRADLYCKGKNNSDQAAADPLHPRVCKRRRSRRADQSGSVQDLQ